MKLTTTSFSLGKEGRPNEDAYGIKQLETGICIAAVADGVGGNLGGATASALAVNSLMEFVHDSPHDSFENAFVHIVNSFVEAIKKDSSLSEMATTLSCIKIYGEIAQFAHVGDSPLEAP